ncbi:MAG: Fic family protein, partial [Proteobacteria bacterium]
MRAKYGILKMLILILPLVGSISEACPKILGGLSTKYLEDGATLCSVQERYKKSLASIKAKGIPVPQRTANLMAPRFINLPDWESKRTADPESASTIYSPAPDTWLKWEKGARMMWYAAQLNMMSDRVAPLFDTFILSVHLSTLSGLTTLAGAYRQADEVGLALAHSTSLNDQQFAGVSSINYRSFLDPNRNIVKFTSTSCIEERDQEFKKLYTQQAKAGVYYYSNQWPSIDPSQAARDSQGRAMHCGFYEYPSVAEVPAQLEAWLNFINVNLNGWNAGRTDMDPILLAARAERWFVAIHPFVKGNGRMGRLMMDYILTSLGLPAPILK